MDVLFNQIEQVVVSSPGVEQIGISIDKGATGDRGNKLYVNSGHPSQVTDEVNGLYYIYRDPAEQLYVGDVYWRTDASRAYQFRSQPPGSSWVEITGNNIVEVSGSINFSEFVYQKSYVTDNTIFSATGHSPGLSLEILVINDTAFTWTLGYPATWTWVTHKPTDIQPQQQFLLQLKSFGYTDADVVADASASVYLYQEAP